MKQDNTLFNLCINSELYFTDIPGNENYLLVEHIGSYFKDLSYIIHKEKKDILINIRKLIGSDYSDNESYSFKYDSRPQMNHLYSYLKDFRPWLSKPQAIRTTQDDLNLLFVNAKPIDMKYSPSTTQSYAKEAVVNITTLYHYELPVYKESRGEIKLDRNWYIVLGDYFKYASERNMYVKMKGVLIHSNKGDYKFLIYRVH